MTSRSNPETEAADVALLSFGETMNVACIMRPDGGPRYESIGFDEQGAYLIGENGIVRLGGYDPDALADFMDNGRDRDFHVCEIDGDGLPVDQYYVSPIYDDATPSFGG